MVEIRTNAGAIVTQYTYDDIIEAYVVSSDENGNFFKAISLQTLEQLPPAVGFSVPVDASNTYVDFRIGNKVYVKLKISTLISTMKSSHRRNLCQLL
jgi:hypothetical protein